MNISSIASNTNNTNFKGAFRVTKVTPQIKQEFQNYAKEGCKVFYDFSKKGDALLVAHDRMNKEIETFFKKVCNISFGFLGNFTPNNYKNIDWIKKLLRYSELPEAHNKSFSKWDCIRNRMKDLKNIGIEIDTDNAQLSMYKGVAMIDDVTSKRKIFVSPNIENTAFIKIYPYSKEENAEYLMYKNQGCFDKVAMVHKKYRTPDEIMEFNKLFNAAKRNYDPDFMKEYPQGRTNLELIVENSYLPEEDFSFIMKERKEAAKTLCYDDTFVPDFSVIRAMRLTNTSEESIKRFYNHLSGSSK